MKIRQFETKATRDTEEGKIDLEGYISPLVLQKYGEYMLKNQVQADGNLRASDNWQNLFGKDHYAVCIKSLWRHFLDMWLEHRGFKSRSGMHDAMMGVLFNLQAYAFKYYQEHDDTCKE